MTYDEPDSTQISFHEATLTGIIRAVSTVSLTLEDVLVADARRSAEVAIEGVNRVLRNGVPIVDLRMEMEDGEVLTLFEESGQVVFALEWNDFKTGRQETVVYVFEGSNVVLRIISYSA